ncbi:hypothetical protein GCM10010361_25090 [Streptomyces olivaceiscleroticus]|uniref:Uncharacterized protein n=1 Tax=Streptomyces olivaceiscleroticus TaxID=68245 RepID=A0ABN0ZVA1_9ACTN
MYAVDLALDLRESVPDAVLADLRRHLDPESPEADDAFPMLAARGPAARIGGVLFGELVHRAGGWALTVRQEIHAEFLPEIDALVERLVPHSRTVGVVGQCRFHEDHAPELLINAAGTLRKTPLRYAE